MHIFKVNEINFSRNSYSAPEEKNLQISSTNYDHDFIEGISYSPENGLFGITNSFIKGVSRATRNDFIDVSLNQ
jgi:hypothetical protein